MKSVLLMATSVVLSACSGLPNIQSGANPADASAPALRSRYAPVIAGAVDYRPVEPKPWTEQNDRVAPKAGSKP